MDKLVKFFFSTIDSKAIIIFRVCVSLMIGYMFAPRGLEVIYPLIRFPEILPYLFNPVYYSIIYLFLILFAIGIKPRIMAVLLFLVLLPHDFLSEGRKSKQVILMVLLCFAFVKSSPIWLFNKNGLIEGPIWPIRLIQLQLTLLYGINAISKSTYHYLSGEALSNMSVVYDQFHVDLSDGYLHLGFISIPVFLLAITSVIVEFTLAIGLWFNRIKRYVAFLGILFHFILTFIMTIFMLDYVSVFLYLAFLIPFEKRNYNFIQNQLND
jgi:hypothetical protein